MSSAAYGLALHTCTPELGVALNNFAGEARAQAWDLGRDLSSLLHIRLAEFLQPQTFQDLAFLAVAKGPGGFTGTRIGVVTARTLAQQLNLPLFGISSLSAEAWQVRSQLVPSADGVYPDIAVEMPAQRGEIFVGIYKIAGTADQPRLATLMADTVVSIEEWLQRLNTWSTPYYLHKIPAAVGLGGSAVSVLELAYQEWQQGLRPTWSDTVPFYGQHPVQIA